MDQEADAIAATLAACNAGEHGAWDRLAPLVYSELRRMADAYMRGERPGHTLQPTALVHESYVRMVEQRLPKFESRSHFLALAARQMRQVLVDSARARRAAKRDAVLEVHGLESDRAGPPLWDISDLDRALQRLEADSPEQGKAIELHYFGGFSVPEMSEMLQRSERSIARDLRAARLYLARELPSRQV